MAPTSSLQLRKRLIILFSILVLFSINLTIDSFDLNEPPPPQEEPISGDDGVGGAGAGAGAGATPPGKISQEKLQKLVAVYRKILKLFHVLRICDNEEFNIEQIVIPNSWKEQYKAMIILNKIGKQKLIKKSDMERYKRIMTNCNAIHDVVQKRAESKLSLESQISGMTKEDVEKLRKQLEESPIEDLRSLISGKTTTTPSPPTSTLSSPSTRNAGSNNKKSRAWTYSSLQTTTPAPSESLTITISGNKRSREDSASVEPKLINFL